MKQLNLIIWSLNSPPSRFEHKQTLVADLTFCLRLTLVDDFIQTRYICILLN